MVASTEIFSTPVIAAIVLVMFLTASFLTNIFQYILYKKELLLNKEKYERNFNGGNSGGNKDFIENEIIKTKSKVKELENERTLEKKIKLKMLNFRLAYLNIEKKALRNANSSMYYWDFLTDHLTKLITLFVPKSNQINPLEDIEIRITDLKNKIGFLADNKESKAYKESMELLNSFLEKYKDSINDRFTIDQYLVKMETTVEGFQRPEVQRFIQQSNSANEYVKDSRDTLESLYEVLERQSNLIREMENEIQQTKDAYKDSVDAKLRLKHQRLTAELDNAKSENTNLQLTIEGLRNSITNFNQKKIQTDEKIKDGLLNKTISDSQISDYTDSIKVLSDEMSEYSSKEVDRLKGLLNRQRDSISKLDGVLDDLREKVKSKDQIIGGLQKTILESEMCIETLEKTIKELMEEKLIGELDGSTCNEDTLKSLNDELQKVKLELDKITSVNEVNENIVSYLYEAVEANSIEDLTALFFQQLIDYHGIPSIEVNFHDKHLSISTTGKMNKNDKLLVGNMAVGETNIDVNGRSIKFRTKYLKGVIRSGEDLEKFKKNHRCIIGVFKATDKLIEKTGAIQSTLAHKKHVDMYKNSIKRLAYEVDKGIAFTNAKHKSVVALSFGEAMEHLQTKLNDGNTISLEYFRKNAIKEIEEDDVLRVKARTMFLKVIKQLEDED